MYLESTQVFSSHQRNAGINRSVDLYGKGIKGPCMTFGYPGLSMTKPLIGQHLKRATDYQCKRVVGMQRLSKSLRQTGSTGYKNPNCPTNVLRAGPVAGAEKSDGFGCPGSNIGSSVYHGKVHQSGPFSSDIEPHYFGTVKQYQTTAPLANLNVPLKVNHKTFHYAKVVDQLKLSSQDEQLRKQQLASSPVPGIMKMSPYLVQLKNQDIKVIKAQLVNHTLDKQLKSIVKEMRKEKYEELRLSSLSDYQAGGETFSNNLTKDVDVSKLEIEEQEIEYQESMGSGLQNEMDIADEDLEVKRYGVGTPDAKNLNGTLSSGQTGSRNLGTKGINTALNHYSDGRQNQSAFDRFNHQTIQDLQHEKPLSSPMGTTFNSAKRQPKNLYTNGRYKNAQLNTHIKFMNSQHTKNIQNTFQKYQKMPPPILEHQFGSQRSDMTSPSTAIPSGIRQMSSGMDIDGRKTFQPISEMNRVKQLSLALTDNQYNSFVDPNLSTITSQQWAIKSKQMKSVSIQDPNEILKNLHSRKLRENQIMENSITTRWQLNDGYETKNVNKLQKFFSSRDRSQQQSQRINSAMDEYHDGLRVLDDSTMDSHFQMTAPGSDHKQVIKMRNSTIENTNQKEFDPNSALQIKRLDQAKLQTRINLLENSKETPERLGKKEFDGKPETQSLINRAVNTKIRVLKGQYVELKTLEKGGHQFCSNVSEQFDKYEEPLATSNNNSDGALADLVDQFESPKSERNLKVGSKTFASEEGSCPSSRFTMTISKDPKMRGPKKIKIPSVNKLKNPDFNFFTKHCDKKNGLGVDHPALKNLGVPAPSKTNKDIMEGEEKGNFEDQLIYGSEEYKQVYQDKERLENALKSQQFKNFSVTHKARLMKQLKIIRSLTYNKDTFSNCKELVGKCYALSTHQKGDAEAFNEIKF